MCAKRGGIVVAPPFAEMFTSTKPAPPFRAEPASSGASPFCIAFSAVRKSAGVVEGEHEGDERCDGLGGKDIGWMRGEVDEDDE